MMGATSFIWPKIKGQLSVFQELWKKEWVEAGPGFLFFGKNTPEVTKCLYSSRLEISDAEFEFYVKGRVELILAHFSKDRLSGQALVGNNFLTFKRLPKKFANPLIHAADKADCL